MMRILDGRFAAKGTDFDLEGLTPAPAWIDSHSHILPTGLDLLKLNLRGLGSPEEVLEALRDWTPTSEWIHAVQYDQTRFPGAKHLSRWDLDAVISDRPVLLRHSNGHASVANSAALAAAGIDESVEDMPGGEFVRDENGRLTGVLLERAHEMVTSRAPAPDLEQMVEAILRAGRLLASMGITCASDFMTGRWNLNQELTAYRIASERGCAIRTRLWLQWATVLGPRGIEPSLLQDHLAAMDDRVCGVRGLKIFADGAIGSATAAIHGRYKTTDGQGQLIYSVERLNEMIRVGHDAGWSIAIHSIGDRSTDLVMDALAKTDDPSRHRIEHVMILSDAQIERLASLNCMVTLQPEFLVRFGHAYRAQLPDDIWPSLKRGRSLLDAGLRLALNTDRPIVVGDPLVGIECAVNRPDGFDSFENISQDEAIAGWTVGAALVNNDGSTQGKIADGFEADFRLINDQGDLAKTVRGGEITWSA